MQQARSFVDGMGKDEFVSDLRTQQAVVMNLVINSEAVTRIMDLHPDFAELHPEVP